MILWKRPIKINKAKEEVEWLINREYKLDTVVTFISNRYQFSNRQRDCIKRVVCTNEQKEIWKSKVLSIDKLSEGTIYIDGLNLIITLEVALSKGTLIVRIDDNIRDLAELRWTYKVINKTVFNSGNLKYKILECVKNINIDVNVELVNNADVILEKLDRVVMQ